MSVVKLLHVPVAATILAIFSEELYTWSTY